MENKTREKGISYRGGRVIAIHCNNCGKKIEDGERIYLLMQGKLSDKCFIHSPYPLHLLICKECTDSLNVKIESMGK